MCFAGDGQGGTGGGGGSKVLYSSSTGSGIAPTALSLLLLVFPFSTLAVRQQLGRLGDAVDPAAVCRKASDRVEEDGGADQPGGCRAQQAGS
jgi:hypothetical protein